MVLSGIFVLGTKTTMILQQQVQQNFSKFVVLQQFWCLCLQFQYNQSAVDRPKLAVFSSNEHTKICSGQSAHWPTSLLVLLFGLSQPPCSVLLFGPRMKLWEKRQQYIKFENIDRQNRLKYLEEPNVMWCCRLNKIQNQLEGKMSSSDREHVVPLE